MYVPSGFIVGYGLRQRMGVWSLLTEKRVLILFQFCRALGRSIVVGAGRLCMAAGGGLAGCLLVACASVPGEPLRLAAGLPVSRMVEAYGKPYRISESRDFHTYVWHLSEARLDRLQGASGATVTGAGVVTYGGSSLPRIVTVSCTLTARVSLELRLLDWQSDGDGDDCRQLLYRQL